MAAADRAAPESFRMTQLRLSQGAAATRILGIGSTQPERVVTNDELSTIMDTNDQWIRERVGIAERRFAGEKDTVVSMAVEAGSKAIAAAGLVPSDVDTVLVANCTATVPIPNAAAQVAELVGVKAGGGFDLNAACAGFCYALAAGSDMVRAGSARPGAGDRLGEAHRRGRPGRPVHGDHLRRRRGRRGRRSERRAGHRPGRVGHRR